MIIEAKATKTPSPHEDADPYGFTEEKPWRKPMAIATLMTGLALYLKSVFPGWGQVPHQTPADPEIEAPQRLADDLQLALDDPIGRLLDPMPVGGMPDLAGFGMYGLGGRLVDPQRSAMFLTVDDPDMTGLEIVLPEVAARRGVILCFPAADTARSANDNAGAPADDGGAAELQELLDQILAGNTLLFPTSRPLAAMTNQVRRTTTRPSMTARRTGLRAVPARSCSTTSSAAASPCSRWRTFSPMPAYPACDALSIANLTISSGTITQSAGGWSFAAAGLGPVTLTYEISDGALTIVQKAVFSVNPNLPILGTRATIFSSAPPARTISRAATETTTSMLAAAPTRSTEARATITSSPAMAATW